MAYKKDQGRYARMTAFWALFLLLAFGCLGGAGLATTLRGWSEGLGKPWGGMQSLPLIGDLDTAKLIAVLVLAAGGYLIHRALNRPRLADLMISTEEELKGVTWPTPGETWTGTIAVILTVTVLVVFLYVTNFVLTAVLPRLMGVPL